MLAIVVSVHLLLKGSESEGHVEYDLESRQVLHLIQHLLPGGGGLRIMRIDASHLA